MGTSTASRHTEDLPTALIEGVDGALYGAMQAGPASFFKSETWPADVFAGAIFRLTVPPLPARQNKRQ